MTKTEHTWQECLLTRARELAQQEKILEYILHRLKEGARLEDVLEEPYVRRNCSQPEIDEVLVDPRVIRAARESLVSTL